MYDILKIINTFETPIIDDKNKKNIKSIVGR